MRFLPRLLVLLAFVVVLVSRPDLLTSAVSSPRAWAGGLGIAVLAVGAGLLVKRRSTTAAPWVSAGITIGLMGALLGPSFFERTVDEAFPVAVVGSAPSAGPISPSGTPTSAPPAGPASPSGTPTSAVPVAARLLTGKFRGIDHTATGAASVYRVGDGLVLRLENVDIQRVPKASVHLVPRGQETPEGGIRLGDLKGEKGSFSYANVPADFDPSKGWSVLIWCDPFSTPVAAVNLS